MQAIDSIQVNFPDNVVFNDFFFSATHLPSAKSKHFERFFFDERAQYVLIIVEWRLLYWIIEDVGNVAVVCIYILQDDLVHISVAFISNLVHIRLGALFDKGGN